jgi:AcrR family transcriptional regulator
VTPPRNERRREELTDAAIAILGTRGIHALSHRAVDEAAGVPGGTASNYFRGRDELLDAAARRVVDLQLTEMAASAGPAGAPLAPRGLADLLARALYTAAIEHRVRFLAIFELRLEATRRPALAEALTGLAVTALGATAGHHDTIGLATSPSQVETLVALYGGALFTLVTAPPEIVTPETADALAQAIVRSTGWSSQPP